MDVTVYQIVLDYVRQYTYEQIRNAFHNILIHIWWLTTVSQTDIA